MHAHVFERAYTWLSMHTHPNLDLGRFLVLFN